MNIQILAQKFYDYSLFIRGYSKHTIKRYKVVINSFQKRAQISNVEEITEKESETSFIQAALRKDGKLIPSFPSGLRSRFFFNIASRRSFWKRISRKKWKSQKPKNYFRTN